MDVKEQDILGDRIGTHWYYACKSAAMLQFLDGCSMREVLDVGAGSGFFSRQLLQLDTCQRATCVDTAYPHDWTETRGGKQISFVRGVDDVTQDLILMMDVIEHVDNDVDLIRSYTDRARAGTALLVTVPAFQFLWSGHDVFLEHRRRYTLSTLHQTMEQAGLQVLRSRYFFAILFPAICAVRLWRRLRMSAGGFPARSDLRIHPAWQNALLRAAHDLERRTVFNFNTLAGLTVFCLARKT